MNDKVVKGQIHCTKPQNLHALQCKSELFETHLNLNHIIK